MGFGLFLSSLRAQVKPLWSSFVSLPYFHFMYGPFQHFGSSRTSLISQADLLKVLVLHKQSIIPELFSKFSLKACQLSTAPPPFLATFRGVCIAVSTDLVCSPEVHCSNSAPTFPSLPPDPAALLHHCCPYDHLWPYSPPVLPC